MYSLTQGFDGPTFTRQRNLDSQTLVQGCSDIPAHLSSFLFFVSWSPGSSKALYWLPLESALGTPAFAVLTCKASICLSQSIHQGCTPAWSLWRRYPQDCLSKSSSNSPLLLCANHSGVLICYLCHYLKFLLSPCCLSPTKVIAIAIMYHIYMLALQAANRILVPQSGIESMPLAVEIRVLTTDFQAILNPT